jgi:asparagine synthase (glutamine-hydrolysing)
MCGIAAIIGGSSPTGNIAVRRRLSGILSRIAHRGQPNHQAEIATGPGWAVGTNRLAITSDADYPQPILSPDRNITLVFNGEIYNHKLLASEYGVSTSFVAREGDGAVAAAVLSRDGIQGLGRLDGMFAIVWIDTASKEAVIARDHIGIKPVYYAVADGMILVASEIKGLAAERTVSEIMTVQPGSFVRVAFDGGEVRVIEDTRWFFDLRSMPQSRVATKDLRRLLHDAVRLQSAYPGPIGVYLSGGIDSSGIYAIARQYHSNVVPLILDSKDGPDGTNAKRLINEIGGDPVIELCPPEEDLFAQVLDTIRIVESFEPNVVRQSSVQRYIAGLAAHQNIKVILCGEGADELFCGYPEFWDRLSDWNDLRLSFLRDLHRTQLQRVDRMSMNITTEVRVPYLAPPIIQAALSNKERNSFLRSTGSQRVNKAWLRQALKDVLPQQWIRYRPKVVLSEGVGLGGNQPDTGMFRRLADSAITDKEAQEIQFAFPEWNLRTKEEALYFKMFESFGYAKARFMQRRVAANSVNSIPAMRAAGFEWDRT